MTQYRLECIDVCEKKTPFAATEAKEEKLARLKKLKK